MKLWVAKVYESVENNEVFISKTKESAENAAAGYILSLWKEWGIGHPPADNTPLEDIIDDFPLDLRFEIIEKDLLD